MRFTSSSLDSTTETAFQNRTFSSERSRHITVATSQSFQGEGVSGHLGEMASKSVHDLPLIEDLPFQS